MLEQTVGQQAELTPGWSIVIPPGSKQGSWQGMHKGQQPPCGGSRVVQRRGGTRRPGFSLWGNGKGDLHSLLPQALSAHSFYGLLGRSCLFEALGPADRKLPQRLPQPWTVCHFLDTFCSAK